jgi:hypothetical protein
VLAQPAALATHPGAAGDDLPAGGRSATGPVRGPDRPDQRRAVQPAQAVHVAGETARLLEVGEVPDDGRTAPVQEVADGREPVAVASVDDDLVPVVEQRLRGRGAMLVDVDIAEFGGRTAVPLIVICQCAVVRRVVAP